MTVLTVQHTGLFDKTVDTSKKFIVHQGGTRSSKTYSILQYLIFWVALCQDSASIVSVVRKSFPSMKSSVMRDFFDILKANDLYDETAHNKTDNTYVLNNTVFEFFSMDIAEKKKGSKRDYLFVDEANELNWEDFFQLMIRTSKKVLLSYNPSFFHHWIYDRIIEREDCEFIKSTYLDNDFLEKSLIDEIERLKDTDEHYWRVYGLGEKGESKSTIYTNWRLCDEFPDFVDDIIIGIDFGFNNPTAVVKVGVYDEKYIYIQQLLYETKLTNSDLIQRLKDLKIGTSTEIKCDCADPERIEELRRAGFNAQPCMKGKNSVKNGIDKIKRHSLYITKDSVDVIKEIKFYKWKEDKDGNVLDEPVKFNDHALDGLRYACGDINTTEFKIRELDWGV